MIETKIKVAIDSGKKNVTGWMQKRMGCQSNMCVCNGMLYILLRMIAGFFPRSMSFSG